LLSFHHGVTPQNQIACGTKNSIFVNTGANRELREWTQIACGKIEPFGASTILDELELTMDWKNWVAASLWQP
jgi:hypothetical protein